jgi:hypothetical protein
MNSTEVDRVDENLGGFAVVVREVVDGDPGTAGAPNTLTISFTVSIESKGGKLVHLSQPFADGADASRAMMLAVVALRLGLPKPEAGTEVGG